MSVFKFRKNTLPLLNSLFKQINISIVRCVSTTDTLEPINMSYATYESTSNKENQSSPFVIIHGLFGSKSNWNSMCKVYNQKCNPSRKVIAVDARNHGDSPHSENHTYAHIAADIKGLFEQISIDKAVLMGHSMGGRACMLFALKYPELVDKLIIADISPVRDSPHLFTMPAIFQTLERIKLPSDTTMSKCRLLVDEELSKSIDDKGLRAFLLTNLIEKSTVNLLFPRNFSSMRLASSTGNLEPISMSYAIYESSKKENPASPLIVLHGLFGSKSNWNSLCRVYSQKCSPTRKIIAVDSRNHGDSPHTDSHTYADMTVDIKALFENLSIKKAILLGHSMGGRACVLFAFKFSKLVEKLIVADISPLSDSPHLLSTHSILQSLQKIKLPTNITLSKCRLLVDKELSNFINNKGLRAFLLTNLVEKSKGNFQWRINIPALLTNFNHLAKFPILNDVQYDGPTLFVAGGNSDFINSLPKHESIELAYNSYEFTNTYSEENPEPTPLIILHGLLGTKNNWNTFSKRLHKDTKAKIIAVDARNHGDSPHYREHDYDAMAVDLKNYIEKMKLAKVNLLGHAMGGRTAMLFALKYPELVEKLIVADISPISTSPNAKTIPRILQSLKQIQIPPTKSLREARKIIAENLFNLVKNKLVLGYLLTNLVQKIDGSYGWRFNTKAILDNYDKICTFPETFNISFEGPTLFVGGLKSDYLPKSDFPQIKKLFPNAELKFIEGAGHWLHSEKPAEFLSITLEFLNRKDTS